LWPWMISGVIAGLLIVLIAITTLAHSPSKNPPLTPHATATPPSGTQGLENYLLHVAQNSHPNGTLVTSTYDPNAKSVLIVDRFNSLWDSTSAKFDIEYDCLVIQQAIWRSNIPLYSVTVNISAPGRDQKGNLILTRAGLCEWKEQTARSFTWETLTPFQAWMTYDVMWLNPAINQ